MDKFDNDFLKAHINTIILKSLQDGDKYGLEILDFIKNKSEQKFELKQPTLYSALKRLETSGHISSFWKKSEIGGNRHYYCLSETGKEELENIQNEWKKTNEVIGSFLNKGQAFKEELSPGPLKSETVIIEKLFTDDKMFKTEVENFDETTSKSMPTSSQSLNGQHNDAFEFSTSLEEKKSSEQIDFFNEDKNITTQINNFKQFMNELKISKNQTAENANENGNSLEEFKNEIAQQMTFSETKQINEDLYLAEQGLVHENENNGESAQLKKENFIDLNQTAKFDAVEPDWSDKADDGVFYNIQANGTNYATGANQDSTFKTNNTSKQDDADSEKNDAVFITDRTLHQKDLSELLHKQSDVNELYKSYDDNFDFQINYVSSPLDLKNYEENNKQIATTTSSNGLTYPISVFSETPSDLNNSKFVSYSKIKLFSSIIIFAFMLFQFFIIKFTKFNLILKPSSSNDVLNVFLTLSIVFFLINLFQFISWPNKKRAKRNFNLIFSAIYSICIVLCSLALLYFFGATNVFLGVFDMPCLLAILFSLDIFLFMLLNMLFARSTKFNV